jgi:hypothetical protein
MFVAYEDFFTRGANLVRDLKPHMARHQQCAEQAKTEYEDIRARSRGFVPPTPPTPRVDPAVPSSSPLESSFLLFSVSHTNVPDVVTEQKRLFGMPLADVMAREGGQLPRVIQNAMQLILRPEGSALSPSDRLDAELCGESSDAAARRGG